MVSWYWKSLRVRVWWVYLDVDECAGSDRGGCSHECVNTQGSYECVCPPGYRVAEDQRTCQGLHNHAPCFLGFDSWGCRAPGPRGPGQAWVLGLGCQVFRSHFPVLAWGNETVVFMMYCRVWLDCCCCCILPNGQVHVLHRHHLVRSCASSLSCE